MNPPVFLVVFIKFFAVLLCVSGWVTSARAMSAEPAAQKSIPSVVAEYQDQIREIDLASAQAALRAATIEEDLKNVREGQKTILQTELNTINKQITYLTNSKKEKINALRQFIEPLPVEGAFGEVLFLLYADADNEPYKERAKSISLKIKELAQNEDFSKHPLNIVQNGSNVFITWQQNRILSVTENDAIWQNTNVATLSEDYKNIIQKAIVNYQEEVSYKAIAKKIALSLFIVLTLATLIFYLNRLSTWSAERIQNGEWFNLKGISIRNYTIFEPDKQIKLLLAINKAIKLVVLLLVIFFIFLVLFSLFPWTENLTYTLFSYVYNPIKDIVLGVWNYLPNLFTILIIIIVFKYVFKGIHYLKLEIETGNLTIPNFYADWANPTYHITRVVLSAFMIVLIFPYLPGSNSPVFQGVSVFIGFLLTFGSAGSLSNIIAGIIITYMRLFFVGDRIKIGEVVGDVVEKSLLVTRVRTIKNEIISIPNATVMNCHTINYSCIAAEHGLILHTSITIGYDVPWKKVYEALLLAAARTDLVLKQPAPFVLQTALNDFHITYQLNAYTQDAGAQVRIYSALHENIQDSFNEAGIEIMSPTFLALRDGNSVTIPQNHRPDDYKAPAFSVAIKPPHIT